MYINDVTLYSHVNMSLISDIIVAWQKEQRPRLRWHFTYSIPSARRSSGILHPDRSIAATSWLTLENAQLHGFLQTSFGKIPFARESSLQPRSTPVRLAAGFLLYRIGVKHEAPPYRRRGEPELITA